jgi:Fe-S oxidoreductase
VSRTDAVTRILFEAFSAAEVRLFYVLGYAAIAVFLYGFYVQIRKYRRGAAFHLEGGLWRRIGDMSAQVLSHRTIARRDAAAGAAHRLIFYGFLLLFAGTATITLQYDILEPLFGIRFWHGRFYLVFSLILDVAGIALIAGLVFMMYRRGWLRLPKLDYARPDRVPGDPDFNRPQYRREDWAFLWLLLIIACTGYVLEAARLVWLQDRADVWDTRWWSPVGAMVAAALRAAGLGVHGGGLLRHGLWWFHGLIALLLIALIPFTKVKHIFTAAASLMVRDPVAAQRLARVPDSQEQPGAAKITDFNWKQLLNLDACTKCGRCHEACPARAVGAPLSPRDVILSLREFAHATLESGTVPEAAELDIHGKAPGQVAMETLWSCRTCMACVEICPVAVEHVPIIVQMRRKLVEDGVDFGILYDGESNAGNDVRRVGEEGLYEVLATANVNALASASFKSIVTTDPHSFNTIRNEYPDFGGKYEIEHYTTLLKRLFAERRLQVTHPLSYRVTFHDPCHLGRFNKGYDAPRELLALLGCELVEMGRCKANSFCCGAGGGRIWVPDPVGSEKPAQNRMKEAAVIPGLEVYVVSCPKDLTMFEDALKTTGNEGKFVVKELIELTREAIPAHRAEGVTA